jgi:hypothetical protein
LGLGAGAGAGVGAGLGSGSTGLGDPIPTAILLLAIEKAMVIKSDVLEAVLKQVI